jgi:hypothetical protein
MSMSEWTNVPAEVRQNYACKVCSNYPDEEGVLDHGRGCYMIDENGGGSEYIEMDHPTPAPLKPLASDITQEQANELQDILRTLVPSGVALITSARELVKRYEAAKRYGETREATLAALQEKTEQALAAAEARAEEAEKERDAAFKQAADFQRNSYENYLDATGAGLEDALTAAEARIAELERELDQYSEWKCAEIARAKSREFALQADRAALAERIRGLKDKPCGMFTYKCIADFYHAGIDAAASLVEGQPQG